jgi:hypothetical protein
MRWQTSTSSYDSYSRPRISSPDSFTRTLVGRTHKPSRVWFSVPRDNPADSGIAGLLRECPAHARVHHEVKAMNRGRIGVPNSVELGTGQMDRSTTIHEHREGNTGCTTRS